VPFNCYRNYNRQKSLFMPAKYKKITKDILFYIASAGVLAIAATSPYFFFNIAKNISKDKKYKRKRYKPREIARVLQRLRNGDLITIEKGDSQIKIWISEKGQKKVSIIESENLIIQKPQRWDKKWRLIIFDIPDKNKKAAREALRSRLKRFGFYQLQKSVWAYPFPCEKEIRLICQIFDINPYVNIVLAENIEDDFQLRKYFGLDFF